MSYSKLTSDPKEYYKKIILSSGKIIYIHIGDIFHTLYHCASSVVLINIILSLPLKRRIRKELAYTLLYDLHFHLLFEIRREICIINPAFISKFRKLHRNLCIMLNEKKVTVGNISSILMEMRFMIFKHTSELGDYNTIYNHIDDSKDYYEDILKLKRQNYNKDLTI